MGLRSGEHTRRTHERWRTKSTKFGIFSVAGGRPVLRNHEAAESLLFGTITTTDNSEMHHFSSLAAQDLGANPHGSIFIDLTADFVDLTADLEEGSHLPPALQLSNNSLSHIDFLRVAPCHRPEVSGMGLYYNGPTLPLESFIGFASGTFLTNEQFEEAAKDHPWLGTYAISMPGAKESAAQDPERVLIPTMEMMSEAAMRQRWVENWIFAANEPPYGKLANAALVPCSNSA